MNETKGVPQRVNRRGFLKWAAAWGFGTAVTAACAPFLPEYKPDPNAATIPPEQDVDINATQVAATTTAQSPEQYQVEIEKIPRLLFDTAGMVRCLNASGSATALEYSNGILYLLTAGHVVQGMEVSGLGSQYGFSFSRPHDSFDVQWGQFQVGYASTPPEQTSLHEFGILAVRISDWPHRVFSMENLVNSWTPGTVEQQLHTLSFPDAAASQTSFPTSFTAFPVTFENNNQSIPLLGTAQNFSGGASGSLAVTSDGKGVAIMVSGSASGNASYFAPLHKPTITMLMQAAKDLIPTP